MEDENKTRAQLIAELVALRKRNSELVDIEKRHAQVEEALRKSEEKYRGLFNNLEEGIAINELVFDESGNVIDYIVLNINPAFEKQSPYRTEEIIGKRATELYQLSTEFISNWWKIHSGMQEATHTDIYHESSGRWFHVVATPPEDNLFATLFTDITERKHADAAREKILEQFKALISHLYMGVLVESDDRKIIHTNQTFCQMFAIPSPEAILGLNCDAAAQGAAALFRDPSHFVERIDRILARSKVVLNEELELNDGRIFERDYVPVYVHGNFIGNMWLYRDITERKRTEEEFRESEKRYRLIAQNADDIIWTGTLEPRLLYASPSVERALGYSVDELKTLTLDQYLTPASFALGLKTLREEIASARAHPDPKYARVLELECVRKDGSTIWLETKFSFFRDDAGRPGGIIAVGRDITDRRKIDEELKQRVKELQSLQATVLEITAPHDLTSLLHTIVERAATLLEADSGGLYLCDTEKQLVTCLVSYHTSKDFTGIVLKYGEGAAGLVAQSGEPLIVDDYRTWSGSAVVFGEEKPFVQLVSAPMLWQGQVTGVIHVLRSEKDKRFSQSDLALLSHFADHAAIAVANARQLETLQLELTERKRVEDKLYANTRQITLLNELTNAALERSDLYETFQILADRLGDLLGADGAYISMWDEANQKTIPVAAYGPLRAIYPTLQSEFEGVTLTESVLRLGCVIPVDDVFNTPYLNPHIARLFPARSILALPMIAGHQKFGAALVGFDQQHHFTEEEIAFGEQISRQIALVVAHISTLQEAQRLAREQSLLFRAARDFFAGLDNEGVLAAIMRHMTSILTVDVCSILRYEPVQDIVVMMLDRDLSSDLLTAPVKRTFVLADHPAMRQVLENRQPLLVHAYDQSTESSQCALLDQYGYTSLLLLPLAVGDRVYGLIALSQKSDAASFSDNDIQLAQNLAGTAAVALENGRLHADVQALAITDGLTGLANRRAFDRVLELEIARTERYKDSVALLILDIDSFKQYNDTFGHPAGDERLKAMAHLFQENVRHPDLVARYGGEEFAILLPNIDKANALLLAERLRVACEEEYRQSNLFKKGGQLGAAGSPIPGYTVSIGVAACPEDAQAPEDLLRAADNAEMAAKRCGKNRVCVANTR